MLILSEMNLPPRFLAFDQVIALHKLQIDQFGGSPGVRDEGLLHSTLAQPQTGSGDKYFYDGNKRIAAIAAAVFLQVNGLRVTADEDEFEKLVMDTDQGLVSKKHDTDDYRCPSLWRRLEGWMRYKTEPMECTTLEIIESE